MRAVECADEMIDDDLLTPPGPSLRDPGYQDLCAFFATFPPASERQPRFGDWVAVPPSVKPLLVLAGGAGAGTVTVGDPEGSAPREEERARCVWLPTLDQLRILLREEFGTSGFFSSAYNDTTYWFTGQLLGMTVTNLQPLAEGSSPEEAAIKALLMRHQR